MRRFQQELILEMLELCEKEQNTISQMKNRSDQGTLERIEVCKEYSLQLQEFIESVYGTESRTVALLQEYSSALESMGAGSLQNWLPPKQLLLDIKQLVKQELKPDRIEIVFFPYKASMADSMESFYLAAKEDSACDAYWIPVPYFDKNPDGTIGVGHYEGMEYGDYMNALDYRSYALESRHPDIVVTHNPYDRFNHVTTIHPDYYSDVLKKHSDYLVYLDYGIPIWLTKDPRSVVKADQVIMYPIQIHADLYVAYSEEMARCCRLALEICPSTKNLFTQEEISRRVMPLGSPKFDLVVNRSQKDYPLSDEWLERVDGKKVLLFCTSITELLEDGEGFLQEIREVLDLVALQKEIALWWRPHPLTESTLKSMRPEMQEQYEGLVDQFHQMKSGIYDDTGDLHRAIAWSDACLTGESSLMYLYLATGKPFTVLAPKKKIPNPGIHKADNFEEPLRRRVENMRAGKGANVGNWNCCIWWDNFLQEDTLLKIHYENFLQRFLHYIIHMDSYRQAEEYRELQLQMYHDFVANSDGTSGKAIFEHCKLEIEKKW